MIRMGRRRLEKTVPILLLSILMLSAIFISEVLGVTYTLREYYDTGGDTPTYIYGDNCYAQTWTTTSAYNLGQVELYIWKTGSPTWALYVMIYETADGKPSNWLKTYSLPSSSCPSSPTWFNFTYTPFSLSASTKYAIVLKIQSGGDVSNCYNWEFDTGSSTYTGGDYGYSSDGGTTWTMTDGKDFMFKTYSATNSYSSTASQGATVTLTGAVQLQATRTVSQSATVTLSSTGALGTSRTATQEVTVTLGSSVQKFIARSVGGIGDTPSGTNTGTNNGATWTWDSTLGRYVLSFDGLNDYVSVPYSANLYSAKWAYAIWIKLLTDPGAYNERIMQYSDASTYDRWLAVWTTTKYIESGFIDTTGAGRLVRTTAILSTNLWYFIVTSFDGTYIRIYIDGVLSVTSTNFAAYTPRNNNLGVWFGRLLTNYKFIGLESNAQIYNRAINTTEISYIYANNIPLNATGLVGWWKMNEGTGNTIYDWSSTTPGPLVVSLYANYKLMAGRTATQPVTVTLGTSTQLSAHRTNDLSMTVSLGATARIASYHSTADMSMTVTLGATCIRIVHVAASLSVSVSEDTTTHYIAGRTADVDVGVATDADKSVDYKRVAPIALTASMQALRTYQARRTVKVLPSPSMIAFGAKPGVLTEAPGGYGFLYTFYTGSEPYDLVAKPTLSNPTDVFYKPFYINASSKERPVWINVEVYTRSMTVPALYTGPRLPFINYTIQCQLTPDSLLFKNKYCWTLHIVEVSESTGQVNMYVSYWYGLAGSEEQIGPTVIVHASEGDLIGGYRLYQFCYAPDQMRATVSAVDSNGLYNTILNDTSDYVSGTLEGYVRVWGYSAVELHFHIESSDHDIVSDLSPALSGSGFLSFVQGVVPTLQKVFGFAYNLLGTVFGLILSFSPLFPYVMVFLPFAVGLYIVGLMATGNWHGIYEFSASILNMMSGLLGAISSVLQILIDAWNMGVEAIKGIGDWIGRFIAWAIAMI